MQLWPTFFSPVEGANWVKWQCGPISDAALTERDPIGIYISGTRVHALKFRDGREWDSINGWRGALAQDCLGEMADIYHNQLLWRQRLDAFMRSPKMPWEVVVPRKMIAADIGLIEHSATYYCYDCAQHVSRRDIDACTICGGTLWR